MEDYFTFGQKLSVKLCQYWSIFLVSWCQNEPPESFKHIPCSLSYSVSNQQMSANNCFLRFFLAIPDVFSDTVCKDPSH